MSVSLLDENELKTDLIQDFILIVPYRCGLKGEMVGIVATVPIISPIKPIIISHLIRTCIRTVKWFRN